MHKYLFSFSKLIFLFAMVSIFFVGCQNMDNVSTPVDSLDKKGDPLVWGNPLSMGDLDNGPVEVELIAGQFYKVGMVKVEKFGAPAGIKVTYTTDIAGGYIEEIHVDLASTLSIWNGTTDLTGFHVTETGSPSFGQFDSKTLATVTSSPDNKIWEVVFTEANLKTALGVGSLNNNTKFYIAAHSGVCFPGTNGGTTSGPATCPEWVGSILPMTALPRDANFTMDQSPYPFLLNGVEVDGYCADPGIEAIAVGVTADFEFICLDGSYVWPLDCTAFESYDNFDVINYFLNIPMPDYPANVMINGNPYSIGKKDAQMIVWCLLFPSIDGSTFNGGFGGANNPAYFPAIVNDLLAAGADFEPECGDFIGVIAYESLETLESLCSREGSQPFILRIPTECTELQCETAMGFDAYDGGDGKWYPVANNSSLFPGHVWFRYFAFTW